MHADPKKEMLNRQAVSFHRPLQMRENPRLHSFEKPNAQQNGSSTFDKKSAFSETF